MDRVVTLSQLEVAELNIPLQSLKSPNLRILYGLGRLEEKEVGGAGVTQTPTPARKAVLVAAPT